MRKETAGLRGTHNEVLCKQRHSFTYVDGAAAFLCDGVHADTSFRFLFGLF